MDNGQSCSYASGSHPNCSACDIVVFRRSEHAHVFRVNPRRADTLCGRCFVACAAAAVPVFQAAEALGIEPDAAAINDAVDNGRIMVLYQSQLGFSLS
jgi:hypothetical protein